MTEAEMKLAALKFASDMCQATRLATIEECAKLADGFAKERLERANHLIEERGGPAYRDNAQAAYSESHAAGCLAKAIRSLNSSVPLDKEG